MKKYLAKIIIMPHKELLDPQGKTVAKNIGHMDIQGIQDVRIGKHIEMSLLAENEELAQQTVDLSCRKLLTNLITETYSFQIQELAH
ncbi:MAG: phosphoribosylformylglycinamidine synthase subunit PurS [Saprospiraceae bacterium]|jgi:phosphoribosylformylglycinamidine synthase|uniref:Phosphoribosylformylglycinamidine synthase subunit PurS n=1 Tax=Candidatus Defluviibacterium haderslevense TaxID=2981993 RepID=A0A9D7SAP7_9BACT|nr:phosphoribosylformylglycinamidine synthase subunit PurS [Candidatus Defluviibacterium haderslevense]MBK9719147.1 phosphoribosylformylglycinamidine synthase subunit PurS [Candidatus Defluviibacterium haderslevense]MBP9083703.1 phosphoribosylformylglycinamidine synthase subunit PurS [Bacteroidia bacterium]MCC7025804.1 phosphoribosylformylglycinamidine synthase subunit PurS [Saprospiraceae bacterium]